MSFADRLREAIDRQGWSQQQLASRSGISQATISYMLKGADPRLSNADALAAALGVDLEWLVGRTESVEATPPTPLQIAALEVLEAIQQRGIEWVANRIREPKAAVSPPTEKSAVPIAGDPPRKVRKNAKLKGDQK